ncbi:MAG: marine proteobacterial sortase target protein [Gammaproteobacteria bacterium]|nr:marine proteobacterial sortase target protein [Gammaproteobacteria bacterium]MDH5303596.1 marine proteobacterial sortase target protein [Gammaproteobacteria bacterium]MDH5323458.1 marine proteobacterial sortase target protein [Gammaproteobacteria bacterium]
MQRFIGTNPALCFTTILILTLLLTKPVVADVQTGLLVPAADGYTTAPLLNTDVNIQVNGLVARVSVMQEFENDSADWVEGSYVFPLPDTAAVDHLRMYIGDRFIEGEIREKAEARREYEAARASGKRTSLVEQQHANLFTTAVANIAPGEKVIIEIEYLEELHYDSGMFSLRYPMTVTPRYSPGHAPTEEALPDSLPMTPPMASATQGQRISLLANVNAGMPLEIVASRYHPVNVAEANGIYLVSLAGGQAPMDHDFELLWRPVPAAVPRAMAFAETINGEPHYLLMVVPPQSSLVSGAMLPREMIFIIDTSGSMHGVSIQQAKEALLSVLDDLDSGDKFNVIEFNSTTRPLFPASVPANAGNIDAAGRFVRALNSEGGTEMYPALDFALRTPGFDNYLRQIIFITDGAVDNEEGLFSLIDARLRGARLFTVGIGSAPNSWFMRKAAEAGRGTFTTISALHEVGEKMDRLFRKLENPQVTDIEVQWPGSVLIDSYPGIAPDLYLGEPISIRARASGPARPGDVVRIAGNSISGAWSSELPLVFNTQSTGIGALWARARISELLDQQRRGGDVQQTRAAVVETALAHHLVSKYTSLVAVDKTAARAAGEPLAGKAVGNLPPRGSTMAAFAATATNAEQLRLSGIACLLLALMLLLGPGLRRRTSYGSLA